MSNIQDINNVSDLENKLSESDMARYKTFSNNNRKLQYLLSRAIIYDNCGEKIIVDKNGVPTIKSGFISVAHKDNWVIVAISEKKVGIDIENTNINRDFMGQSELMGFTKTNDRLDFYKNFVKYEAMFKYGDGATHVHKYFYKMDNYLIGVCSNESISDIDFILSDAVGVHFIVAE